MDDADGAAGRLEEGERLARRLRDGPALALAAFVRGRMAFRRKDMGGVISSSERGLAILSALPERVRDQQVNLRLQLLNLLGPAAVGAGQHDVARRCYRTVAVIAESHGEIVNRTWAMWGLGLVAWRQGDIAEADRRLRDSLRFMRETGVPDPYVAALSVETLAWIAARDKSHHRAATLLGAADRVGLDLGWAATVDDMLIGDHDACERQVRQILGPAAFAEAFRGGQALHLDAALDHALDETPAATRPPLGRDDVPPALTRRERQVADLVADGRSNKEIADALVISRRTADAHLAHILTKLGFTSRAQIAVWVIEQGNRRYLP